jgi:hypothetical protein
VTAGAYGVYTHEDTSEPAPGSTNPVPISPGAKILICRYFATKFAFARASEPTSMNRALASSPCLMPLRAIPVPSRSASRSLEPLVLVVWSRSCL